MTSEEITPRKLDDVWYSRDYPTLVAIMEQVEIRGLPLKLLDINSGLGPYTETQSLRALHSREFITAEFNEKNYPIKVVAVNGMAYIMTGLHPAGEDAKERLISLLEQLADKTDDEEEASKVKQVAKQVGLFGRDTAAAVAAAFASGMLN